MRLSTFCIYGIILNKCKIDNLNYVFRLKKYMNVFYLEGENHFEHGKE